MCGECLSSVGLAALDRAGLTSRLKSLQPTVLVRTLIHTRDGPTLDIPLPRPMWGLTRFAMDRELMAAASEAGVVVRQPARCERLSGGRRPGLTWRDLRSNQVTHTGADWIVVADGKGSLLPPGAPPSTGDLGIKAHFGSVAGPRDAIELFAGPGCYGGLAAVEGNRWNAAFSVPVAMVRQCGGDVAAAFEHIVAFNPTLADRLRNAQRPTRWLGRPASTVRRSTVVAGANRTRRQRRGGAGAHRRRGHGTRNRKRRISRGSHWEGNPKPSGNSLSVTARCGAPDGWRVAHSPGPFRRQRWPTQELPCSTANRSSTGSRCDASESRK